MDKLEKAEKLRERANVSYEEAKAALDATGDDLLEAIVLLERQGKTSRPEQSTYSTSAEEQKQYVRVQEQVEEQERTAPTFRRSVVRLVKAVIGLILHTNFMVTRKEKVIFSMPSWVAAIILLACWKLVLSVMIIALFFGVRYAFEGKDPNAETANQYLDKAGSLAETIEGEIKKESE